MPNIRILPDHLVNQIAAGEVIERPSAALKELVENALDAHATQIDIVLREGGKSYMAVTDNGCGMLPDEMQLALTRHATSKLPGDDLVHITTMGFRGEALPSIASVARLTMISRPANAPDAWQIRVDGGNATAPMPAAHMPGTRIEIRDLFYATPARLKFLKGDLAEFAACKDVIVRLALARPDIGFTLTHNDQKSLNLPCIETTDPESALAARLHDLMGREFHDNTVFLDAASGDITITGRIGYPTYNKGQSNHQYLFVNNRPVRDRLLLSALRVAYGDLMPRDRHAVATLFITLPAPDVDINVHPAKAEVRFRDAGHIRGLMISAIRHRLATLHGSAQALASNLPDRIVANQPYPVYQPITAQFGPAQTLYERPDQTYRPLFDAVPERRVIANAPMPSPETTVLTSYPLGAAIAQVHNTYIIAQNDDGIVLVDQHAAHERLVYERYKQQKDSIGIPCQRLLSPEIITLDDVRAGILLEQRENLASFGLEIEPFGPDCLLVRGVPAEIAERLDLPHLIADLADEMLERGAAQTLEDRILLFLATRACHHSIRAGRVLRADEMNALLRQIEQTPHAAQCNHGRPTFVKLSRHDLERLFERR